MKEKSLIHENAKYTLVKKEYGWFRSALARAFDKIIGLDKLYSQIPQTHNFSKKTLMEYAVDYLSLNVNIKGQEHIKSISNESGFMIITNHPRGLIDGICVGYMINKILNRNDFYFIANKIIEDVFPPFKPYSLSVKNMQFEKNSLMLNSNTILRSIEKVKSGHILALHPAGEVSEFKIFSPEGMLKITDCKWKETFASIALRSKSFIVPVFISGNNSLFYQFISFLGPIAKRMTNFREFLKVKNTQINLEIKKPIDFNEYSNLNVNQISNLVRSSVFNKE